MPESLPWDKNDAPDRRFAKLYQAIIDAVDVEESNPRLETLLDDYLRMLWTLSLSSSIDYIDNHRSISKAVMIRSYTSYPMRPKAKRRRGVEERRDSSFAAGTEGTGERRDNSVSHLRG